MSESSTDSTNSSAWFWACWAALAATFALFAAASFLPGARLWGVNHLAFYSPMVRIAFLSLTGLFLIPSLAAASWRAFLWITKPFLRGLDDGVNAIALSGVISFVLFAAFRSSTRLLGDGYFIVNNFREVAAKDLGVKGYFDLITVNERVYPATELLNYAASWVAGRFGASPAGGVWILGCIIGAAVVVGLLAAVRRTGWSDATKLSLIALALFSGAVELFFGYVEHYAPSLALGVLYVLTVFRALQRQGRVSTPGLVLLAGTLFHVQSLLLAPSYLWLVLWAAVFKRNPSRAAAIVGVLTLVAFVAAGVTPAFRHFFLPPFGTGEGYGVFSSAHMLDVANETLLLSPVWILLAVLLIRDRAISRRERDAGYAITAAFGWSLAVPAGLFLLLFKPELGMARDWDLYCFTVFGLTAPGLIALVRYITRTPLHPAPARLVAPAVALAVAMTISWVGVNADMERSVARYRAILEYDSTNPGYAYETLARHYEDNFQYSRQIDALRSAYDASRNPRLLFKLGRVYNENNQPVESARMLAAYLEAQPRDDEARKQLLGLLARRGAVDEMVEASLEGIEYSPRIPDYYFFLGNAYLAKGMTDEGLKAFESCSRLNPPPVMVREMKRLTEQVQQRRTGPDSR